VGFRFVEARWHWWQFYVHLFALYLCATWFYQFAFWKRINIVPSRFSLADFRWRHVPIEVSVDQLNATTTMTTILCRRTIELPCTVSICYQSRIMESKGSSLVEIRRVSNLVSSCIYGVFVYVFVYVNLIFMSACVLLIFRSIYASQGSTKLTAIAAIHM